MYHAPPHNSATQESGIVFIDEIDKLVSSGDYKSADASSEGVQRDLLPLIEGPCRRFIS